MIIGLGTKVFGSISILLVCSNLWFYTEVHKKESENEILKSNVVQLERTLSNQRTTIESLTQEKLDLNKNILTLTSTNDELTGMITDQIAEINEMRETINEKSIEDPFGTGNIQTGLFNKRLKSIVENDNE